MVKWYLSAFHSGRKSDIAKKPYNPVLGEIFQCWYTIPHLPEDPVSFSKYSIMKFYILIIILLKVVVSDGPVPWATRNQVTFISEQVSHHPPSNFIFKIK